jgi:hypothetical protein
MSRVRFWRYIILEDTLGMAPTSLASTRFTAIYDCMLAPPLHYTWFWIYG